jgi:hypothetical protein
MKATGWSYEVTITMGYKTIAVPWRTVHEILITWGKYSISLIILAKKAR